MNAITNPQLPAPRTDDRQGFRTTEIVERPLAQRPAHDTVDGIIDWLSGAALQVTSGAQVVDELAWRLLAAGYPLLRFSVHSGTLHPQFLGTSLMWWRDTGRTEQTFVTHEVGEAVAYEKNPVARVLRGGETLRRKLCAADCPWDLPVLRDLEAKGATDYLALPIAGAHARRYMATFTTDRAGGFSEHEVAGLTRIAQRASVVCDIFNQRALTRHLLDAYLGSNAGLKVLDGQIRRGTGEEFDVVLWSSDLRAYTARSDRLPGQQMIAILNALFDVQAMSIHKHGGEILKFIGDGLLAIFPVGDAGSAGKAARSAMAAALEARDAVQRLVDQPYMQGEPALDVVFALHAGKVIYGNVGAADRLDFTVIGPAVNLVSRVENVAKTLDEPVVVTDDFARSYGAPLRSLGQHRLRGLATARELFAPPATGNVG